MITWIRPSGTEIETNESDATVDYAIGAGWKLKDSKEAPKDDNSSTNSKRGSRKTRRKNG